MPRRRAKYHRAAVRAEQIRGLIAEGLTVAEAARRLGLASSRAYLICERFNITQTHRPKCYRYYPQLPRFPGVLALAYTALRRSQARARVEARWGRQAA